MTSAKGERLVTSEKGEGPWEEKLRVPYLTSVTCAHINFFSRDGCLGTEQFVKDNSECREKHRNAVPPLPAPPPSISSSAKTASYAGYSLPYEPSLMASVPRGSNSSVVDRASEVLIGRP